MNTINATMHRWPSLVVHSQQPCQVFSSEWHQVLQSKHINHNLNKVVESLKKGKWPLSHFYLGFGV
jgi:hypothetical protein